MKKSVLLGLFLFISSILLASCGGIPLTSNQTDENAVNTMVAQTVNAGNLPAQVVVITATPEGANLPTITPMTLSTVTPGITPSATEDACNRAHFVDDITIPDGSSIFVNSTFDKTWRVQNVGTCTWTTSYALVPSSGDDLGAPAATNLTASVPPGGSIDITVTLKAPSTEGNYTQNFKLRSDSGVLFGTGTSYQAPLYVEIKTIHFYAITLAPLIDPDLFPVLPLETKIYSFASNYCSAIWKNGLAELPCPGTTSDSSGFVVRDDSPYLQDGEKYSGPAIFTHPRWIDNGTIAGFFPGIAIENGYHFKTTLGCGLDGNACEALVQLNYSSDGGPTTLLQQWVIKYGDEPVAVNIDLSSFEGHNVKFILAVSAKGPSGQDWIHWVNPRIVK
jgi:hypothetical protein